MNTGDAKRTGPKTNGAFVTKFSDIRGTGFNTVPTHRAVRTAAFRCLPSIGQILAHWAPKTAVRHYDTTSSTVAGLFRTTTNFCQFQGTGNNASCIQHTAHTVHSIDGSHTRHVSKTTFWTIPAQRNGVGPCRHEIFANGAIDTGRCCNGSRLLQIFTCRARIAVSV